MRRMVRHTHIKQITHGAKCPPLTFKASQNQRRNNIPNQATKPGIASHQWPSHLQPDAATTQNAETVQISGGKNRKTKSLCP